LAGEVNDRTKRQERYKKKLNDVQPLNIME